MSLFPDEDKIASNVINETRKREGLGASDGLLRGLEAFNALQSEYPGRVDEVLGELVQGYNGYVNALAEKFPLTTDAYWQNFRRNLSMGSLPMFEDPRKTTAQNDRDFAMFYRKFVTAISREAMGDSSGKLGVGPEPQYELLDRQPQYLAGIGLYILKNTATSDPIKTIWDLRQKEIPRMVRNPSA